LTVDQRAIFIPAISWLFTRRDQPQKTTLKTTLKDNE
jgi:hypothetical protein